MVPETTLRELQPRMTVIMARITGAVFPGAIPVGVEGFEREQKTCVPCWGLGGMVRLRALPLSILILQMGSIIQALTALLDEAKVIK